MKEKKYNKCAVIGFAAVLAALLITIDIFSSDFFNLQFITAQYSQEIFFVVIVIIYPLLIIAALVLSLVAIRQIGKTKEKGLMLAYATLGVMTIFWLLFFLIFIR